MTIDEGVGLIVMWIPALIVVALLLLVLGAIVRFSLVSGRITRDAPDRLRSPEPEPVAALCGFPPSPALVDMYRTAAFIGMTEFYLDDASSSPPARWFIGGFTPLTARDVRELRTVTGVKDGIPIADDLDKGVYFVSRDGAVWFRSPENDRDVRVAASVGQLAAFEVVQDE